ncbi:MAG: glycosyltransferase [Bacteroidales bacterium]|nr:glycosyltransferase [Bacteroidales bacterium]
MLNYLQNHIALIFIVIFGFITLIAVCCYLLFFLRFILFKKKKNALNNALPVSVIVVANNESHFLEESLPLLLTQQYPDYEVVVVNYNSHDDTAVLLSILEKQHAHLRVVTTDSAVTTIKGRKFPLSIGIKESKYDTLLFTRPECLPASPCWLSNMCSHFMYKKEIVLGYSTYIKRGTFFNHLLHFDQLQNALYRFSFALAKMPIMADGANLAYAKKLFIEQKGYALHNHIIAGDDDILVNKTAKKQGKIYNYTIEAAPESFTVSQIKLSFKRWFTLRRYERYAQNFYRPAHGFCLNLYKTVALLFYLSFGAAVAWAVPDQVLVAVTGSIFLLKTAVQYIIYGFAAVRLNEKQTLPLLILWDFIIALLNPLIALKKKR